MEAAHGLLGLSLPQVDLAQAGQGVGLSRPVVGLKEDGKGSLKVVGGPLVPALLEGDHGQAGQRQAPRMNAICECLIGSLRRELLDRSFILGEAHPRAVLAQHQSTTTPPGPSGHRPANPGH
jgi:hypothetical protein